MNIFIDANVLVTVLNKEFPKYVNAAKVLSLSSNKRYKLYTSPICLAIAFYFASKVSGEARAKQKIDEIVKHIRIAPVFDTTVKAALANKKVLDLEDGFQYYAARDAKCDFIVTEDTDDFHFSDIAVYSCAYFLTTQVINRNQLI